MSSPIIALVLPDYFYFVFALCVVVSACIVLFYAKRHPNPHFRPRKSDVAIVSFVLLFLSGGVAFMTSGAFDSDITREKLEKKEEDAKRVAKMKGTSIEEEMGLTQPVEEPSNTNSDLPSDIPDELREMIEGPPK